MAKCCVCGAEIDHYLVYDYEKAVCEPFFTKRNECHQYAVQQGWRLDGALHGESIGWHILETDICHQFQVEMLHTQHPDYVLEWGSGYSTYFLPSKYTEYKRWLAVEHHRFWVLRCQERLLPRVGVLFGPTPEIYARAGDGLKWDFIFIDGVWRPSCAEVANSILAEGGVILAQDYEMKKECWPNDYAFPRSPHWGQFKSLTPDGKTKIYAILANQPLDTLRCADVLAKYEVEIEK